MLKQTYLHVFTRLLHQSCQGFLESQSESRLCCLEGEAPQKLETVFKEYLKLLNRLYDMIWFGSVYEAVYEKA